MSKAVVFDAKKMAATIVDIPDVIFPEPPTPPPTDTEVLDELIDLLVSQGVITNV